MRRVLHAMAEAMVEILRSAGFEARMSDDDLAPVTVEVLAKWPSSRASVRYPFQG
jgi:hypothetical protein